MSKKSIANLLIGIGLALHIQGGQADTHFHAEEELTNQMPAVNAMGHPHKVAANWKDLGMGGLHHGGHGPPHETGAPFEEKLIRALKNVSAISLNIVNRLLSTIMTSDDISSDEILKKVKTALRLLKKVQFYSRYSTQIRHIDNVIWGYRTEEA